MINWKVRIKNKWFWVTIVPVVLLLIQMVGALFGWGFDLEGIQAKIMQLIDAIFVLLAALGVVNDMTTAGLSDSELARTYTKPRDDKYVKITIKEDDNGKD